MAKTSLKIGSKVNLGAVTAATWLHGNAPKSFEPGRIYLFNCWATWCARIVTVQNGNFPTPFVTLACKAYYSGLDHRFPTNPYNLITLASMEWNSGNKEAATTTIKKAVEMVLSANSLPGSATKIPMQPFTKFAKCVEEGEMPTLIEFYAWLTEKTIKRCNT